MEVSRQGRTQPNRPTTAMGELSHMPSGCSVGVCVCTVDRKFVQLKIPRQATVQRDLKCYSAVLSQNCAVPMALRKAKSSPGEEDRSCNLMVYELPEELGQKKVFCVKGFSEKSYNGLSKREACDLQVFGYFVNL
eukprot:sb/3474767/